MVLCRNLLLSCVISCTLPIGAQASFKPAPAFTSSASDAAPSSASGTSAPCPTASLASKPVSSSSDGDPLSTDPTPCADNQPRFADDAVSPLPLPHERHLERSHPIGIAGHIGLGGGGLDLAVPIARQFDLRIGGDFLRYTGSFQQDGANIDAFLQTGYGRAALDWFPGGRWFRVSPMLVFANSTRVKANVTVDSGQQFDFGGDSFLDSTTDPLHGSGRVDLRRTAPGLSVGTGNLLRGQGHFVYPVELGFFYVGQPKLSVSFSGSVCDITHPDVGCTPVQSDPDFQADLGRFIARNNHNLTYARFLPVLSFGIGYRFGRGSSGLQ